MGRFTWPLRNPTIRIRVTVTAALVAGLLAIAFYIVLMVLVRREAADNNRLYMGRVGRQVTTLVQEGRLAPRVLNGTQDRVQVVDAQGHILAASPRMAGFPPVNFPLAEDRTFRQGQSCDVQAPNGDCFLIMAFGVGEGRNRRVVYSLDNDPGLLPRPLIATGLALLVPLISGMVGYGAWHAAGRTLRPVEAIRAELDEITATDLERRVPVPPRQDEVARLATSINATLDRLERAVARLRAFVSDVSHELRSPLTALRMELEIALSEPDNGDLRDPMRSALQDAERLHAVLDDLLALARLEAQRELEIEPVDLLELADQEVLSRPRRTRVTVIADEPVIVRGGRSELGRLLTNLIDNADRHAESAVTIVLRTDGPDTAVVEVSDDGPGIAPEDRERVFERFTRLSNGLHRDAGGTGLGLAISRDIADAHHGTLTITDRADATPGIRFILRLPR
ncbi:MULTISPECIES: sensor histidine kinase [Thermomonosporaceae]|uniref:sensor histidine kinase n=1 Tax=Thermomonosporaceae TaxID=2012 RepID=UPI00255AF96A|nr:MULTISPECIES: ATP-binding protein [Thermomonosporaceae]MDL4772311.1 ATP-binding protein [Actinomadura xylanilytica]